MQRNFRRRIIRIFDILAANGRIKTTLLSEMLDVSLVTLRKDLHSLEKRGIIHRSRGFVGLEGADNTSKRLAYYYSIKQRIAQAAAQTVEENETVMLESGSCCALFAEELALAGKNATIVTNSLFVAYFVRHLSNINIILLGGKFQPESRVLIGPMVAKYAENLFVDKIFLGANGFIPGQCFTGGNYLHAETAVGLVNCAKKVYILTEAAKFNRRGAYSQIPLDKITGVYTDDKIPKEAETDLINHNVLLHKVPAVEEKIKWCRFPGFSPFLYKEKGDCY